MSFVNRSSIRRPKLVAIFAGLAGIATLALGLWLISQERAFEAGAVALEAQVVSVKADRSGSSENALFKPVFTFSDADGRAHTAPAAHSDEAYDFAVGERVPILFNPAQPETVRVNNGSQSSTGLTIALGSLIFFVPAVLGFILHRRWKARTPDYEVHTMLPEDESLDDQIRSMAGRYDSWLLRKPRKMAIILGVVGGLFMAVGVSTLVDDNAFMKTAVATSATVLSVEKTGSNYRPTVGFKTESGAKVTARSALSDSSYNFSAGQHVPIYYDRANPQNIRLQGMLEDGTFAYAIILFALILLGLALYALSIHRSYQKERAHRAALPEEAEVVHSFSSNSGD